MQYKGIWLHVEYMNKKVCGLVDKIPSGKLTCPKKDYVPKEQREKIGQPMHQLMRVCKCIKPSPKLKQVCEVRVRR